MTRSLADGLTDVIGRASSLSDAIKDIGLQLVRSGIARVLEEGLDVLVGAGVDAIFGGARASGGPVTAGKAFLVGERGPELFVPAVSGQIVANGAMAAGPTFIVDARGADVGAVARLERFVAKLHGSVEHRAVAAVNEDRRRTGRG